MTDGTKELDQNITGLLKAFKKITDFAASIDDYDEGHEYASKEVAEARREYRNWAGK